MLYGCDFAWWERAGGVPGFAGLKICQDPKAGRRPAWGLKRIRTERVDRLLLTRRGVVGWGGNSGFHALNLAVQFGATRIALIGFDMRIDLAPGANGLHWHGRHGSGLNNPTEKNVARWRRVIDEAAPVLAARGVEVINCSASSALSAYPKLTLGEALECWNVSRPRRAPSSRSRGRRKDCASTPAPTTPISAV